MLRLLEYVAICAPGLFKGNMIITKFEDRATADRHDFYRSQDCMGKS